MPAARAAASREPPSSTSARASIRRAALASRHRPASRRSSTAPSSFRVTATAMAPPAHRLHRRSTPSGRAWRYGPNGHKPRPVVLALQLRFAVISGPLRRHGLEVADGGRGGQGCAGALGLLAAGGEAADPAAVQPGAGGGLGRAVSGWPAPARAAQDRVDAGGGGG